MYSKTLTKCGKQWHRLLNCYKKSRGKHNVLSSADAKKHGRRNGVLYFHKVILRARWHKAKLYSKIQIPLLELLA